VNVSIIIGFGGIVVGALILWTMGWYFERRDRADAQRRAGERGSR
jgi:hypothetical protein